MDFLTSRTIVCARSLQLDDRPSIQDWYNIEIREAIRCIEDNAITLAN